MGAWVLLAVGVATTAVAWWVVAARGRSIWVVMPSLYAVLGAVSLVVAPAAGRARAWHGWAGASLTAELGWGIASGLALYVATRAVVPILGRWPSFARQTVTIYGPERRVGPVAAVALSLVVVAGEELLWRRAVQQGLAVDAALAAGLTWTASLAANVASGSLPIVAAAAVGGAVWGAGAWLSGGVVVPLVSHAVWTSLMLMLPPALARRKMSA